MRYNSTLAQAMTQPDFCVQALADYTQSRIEDYNKIISAATTIIDEAETYSDDETIPDVSASDIARIATEAGVSLHAQILTSQGYITVEDFLTAYATEYVTELNFGDVEATAASVVTAAGTETKLLASDIMSEMGDNMVNAIGLKTSCDAMCVKIRDGITAGLTAFDSNMSAAVDKTRKSFATINSYYHNLVNEAQDAITFLNNVYNDMGIEELAEDDSDATVANSIIYQCTGASPAGALDFSSVGRAVESVVNAGVKVVKGFFNWVGGKIKSGWKKLTQKFHEVVVDPYDLYEIDGVGADAQPHVENAYYAIDTIGYPTLIPLSGNALSTLKSKFDNSVLYFRTYFGEMEVDIQEVTEGILSTAAFNGQIKIKPYPVKDDVLVNVLERLLPSYLWSPDAENADNRSAKRILDLTDATAVATASGAISKYLSETESLYYTVGDAEADLCRGFCNGAYLMKVFVNTLYQEYTGAERITLQIGDTYSADHPITYNNLFWNNIGSPTNLSFVRVTTGYNPDDPTNFTEIPLLSVQWAYGAGLYDVLGNESMILEIPRLLTVLGHNTLDLANDVTLDAFLPYRKNKQYFSQGKYAIKTDAQNQEAFNNLAVAAVVIVIAIAVTITCGVVAKKVASKLFRKRQTKLASINNTLWSGDPDKIKNLSARDWRKLRRSTIAGSKLTAATSFLPGSAMEEVMADITAPNISNSTYAAITGYNFSAN